MTVKTFLIAVLGFTLIARTTHAETIQISPNAQATIESHDASSVFLPGAFFAAPTTWTADNQSVSTGAPALQVLSRQIELPNPSAGLNGGPSTFETMNEPRGNQSSGSGLSGGGFDPIGGGSVPVVGTVPLPSTMPLFGAALLMLGGLAIAMRNRRIA